MTLGIKHEDRVVANRFDEQLESLLASAQSQLFFEHLRLELKLSQAAKRCFFATQHHFVFVGDHVGVLTAHLEERLNVLFIAETRHRIRAQKKEAMFFGQLVPKLFYTNRFLHFPSAHNKATSSPNTAMRRLACGPASLICVKAVRMTSVNRPSSTESFTMNRGSSSRASRTM